MGNENEKKIKEYEQLLFELKGENQILSRHIEPKYFTPEYKEIREKIIDELEREVQRLKRNKEEVKGKREVIVIESNRTVTEKDKEYIQEKYREQLGMECIVLEKGLHYGGTVMI